MKITDLIEKKKQGLALNEEEIYFIVNGAVNGTIADYQLSAFFMAVYFQGMTIEETTIMTKATVESGTVLDLSKIGNVVADKHSSGGVGDKITLIYLPLVAACGVPLAKLSGKGLGHTGGTIDKLNSIPGFNCKLELDDFLEKVKKTGLAIASQTHNLTPADGKFYALRDVTATIDIIPLIAVSIVSKKIASGANCIILDVKCGEGAFIKTLEDAKKLSQIMVEVGNRLGRKICAVITNMNEPLGHAVGNSVEVIEAIKFLKGDYQRDLKDVTFELAIQTLIKTGKSENRDSAVKLLDRVLESGEALQKFKDLIISQSGDVSVIEDYSKFPQAKNIIEVKAEKSGYINHINPLEIAKATKLLGAGRTFKDDKIDYAVGIYINKKTGEFVNKGEILFTVYANSLENIDEVKQKAQKAFVIEENKIPLEPLIYDVIG
ncbi:thymidine phosphorylase [bacterium]|nr:thymidine phosphorylase [bacterium]